MKNMRAGAALVTFLCLACTTFAHEAAPDMVASIAPNAPAMPALPAIQAMPAVPEVPATAETPAAQAVVASPAPNHFEDSAIGQAYMAVNKELAPVLDPDNIASSIGQLDRFEFSPETKKKLFAVTGSENPLHLKPSKLSNGTTEISLLWDSLDYQDPGSDGKIHASALTCSIVYSKQYTKEHLVAAMPSISYDDGKTTQFAASGLSGVSNRTKGYPGLWFGTGLVRLDRLTADDSARDIHFKLDGMAIQWGIKKRGKLADFDLDYRVKSINWGDDGLGPVHLAMRMNHIDAREFVAVSETAKRLKRSDQTPEEQKAVATGLFKGLGLAMLTHGGAIDIQDLSVQYHGMTAGLKGYIAFGNIQGSDLDTPRLIVEKIKARFDVHVPLTMVTDIARVFARKALASKDKSGQPVTASASAVDPMAKAMVEKVLEKLVRDKWIRIEHNTILSRIEFRLGHLFVNGQAADLPALKTQ